MAEFTLTANIQEDHTHIPPYVVVKLVLEINEAVVAGLEKGYFSYIAK